MTKITFHKAKSGDFRSFECVGHAGYGEYGNDIVCASISVLVINTINSLEELVKEEMDVDTCEDDGIIRCTFKNLHNKSETKLLMESLILGLTQIETQYGKKHCKLTFREV